MLKNILRKICEILLRPFKADFFFLFILTILVSAADIVAWFFYGDPIFGIYMGVHGYIMAYVIVLLGTFLSQTRYKKIYEYIILALAYINFIIDVSIHMSCKIGFTNDMVAIIMGTNLSEGKEFIGTYFSLELLCVIIISTAVLYLIKRYKVYVEHFGSRLSVCFLLLCLFGGIIVFGRRSENWGGVFLCKVTSCLSYKSPPDLKAYFSDPEVVINDGETPDNLLIIIGESFVRSHSSIYGYAKNTNPYLSKMIEDSLLVAYDNVTSSSTSTIKAFQSMMSTYGSSLNTEREWYECTTLLEVLSKAGYNTLWISNQSPTGVHDNVVTKYAELCDSVIWVGSKYKGIRKSDFDEEIIKSVESLKLSDKFNSYKKNVILIHLMGSHYIFNERYPKEFEQFHPNEYPALNKEQAEIISSYDNSILYNDFVVSSILHLFKDTETLAFYFPDHGLDLYDTYSDYFGHAIANMPNSVNVASQIPFMMYCSQALRYNCSEAVEEANGLLSDSFNTADLMQLVMRVLKIQMEEE